MSIYMDGYGYRFFLYSDFRRTTDLRFLIGYPLDHYTYPLIFLLTRSLTHPLTPISSLFTSHFSLLTLYLSSFLSFHLFLFSLFTLSLSLTHGFSLPPSLSLSLSSQYSVLPLSPSRSRSHWVLIIMDSQSITTMTGSFPLSGLSLSKLDLAGSNEILPDLVRSRQI